MASELRLESIKWPKEFPELKALDDVLHCGICYGYIKTCMITSCSHNYCSLCIRKSMQYKTQCPTCFEETYEPNLRNNRAIDQLVELYTGMRDKLLRHLRIADLQLAGSQPIDDHLPLCIKREQYSPIDVIKKNKGESSKSKVATSAVSYSEKASVSRRLDDELSSPSSRNEGLHMIPKMFLSPKKQGETTKSKKTLDIPTVPCPVCCVDIPERNINIHLDNCLESSEKPTVKSPGKRKKRSPIAKMVYSMMSEKDLRKRLKDYGLNSQGDKKVLTNRIQRFTVLYNSECDSDEPRPVADIIRQIEKEENGEKKTVNSILPQPRLPVTNRKTDPKIIDEENKKYLQENKKSFDALINAMKSNQGTFRNGMCPKGKEFSTTIKPSLVKHINEAVEKDYQETPEKAQEENRVLFDSSDDELSEEYPSSPVFKSNKTPVRKKFSGESVSNEKKNSVTCSPYNNSKDVTPKVKAFNVLEKNKNIDEIHETQVLSCVSDSDTSVPSPSCILPEDEDSIHSLDSVKNSSTKENEYQTSPTLRNTTTPLRHNKLSEEYSIDPLFKATKSSDNKIFERNLFDHEKHTPSSSKKIFFKGTPKIKPLQKFGENKNMNELCETQKLQSGSDSDTSVPSPSCILPEDENSVYSLSSEIDAEHCPETEDQVTEHYGMKLKDSQIDDPDFIVEDEDQDSEEIFVSRRSKRKKPTTPSDNETLSPGTQSTKKVNPPTSSDTDSVRTLRKRVKR